MVRLRRALCGLLGHRWWIDERQAAEWMGELVPVLNLCTRCGASRIVPAWGVCEAGGHPASEHYDAAGNYLGSSCDRTQGLR